jgi:UDP-N-acetylglucosamine 2-epimerase (non-hydrolysing)
VQAGAVRVIGTRFDAVFEALSELYQNEELYRKMAVPAFPYGDGHAAARIVEAMQRRFFQSQSQLLSLAG